MCNRWHRGHSGTTVISEFRAARCRVTDEFIEIYNNSGADHMVVDQWAQDMRGFV